MIEAAYTKALNKHLPLNVRCWKINDAFEGGVPDCFYRDKTGAVPPMWSEHKLIKALPKRESTLIVPNLSALQLMWLMEAKEANERVCVVIGCEELRTHEGVKSVILFDPKQWQQGVSKNYFIENALNYKKIVVKMGFYIK